MGKSEFGKQPPATTGSGHKVATPPEMSNMPPLPPGPGPVPTPFVIVASSSTATGTSALTVIDGHEVLVVGSAMDADKPGNQPSQPAMGDLMTHAVEGKVPVTSGSGDVHSDGSKVACTLDTCAVNVMTKESTASQMTGVLLGPPELAMAGAGSNADGTAKAGGATAIPAQKAPAEGAPGAASSAAAQDQAGHPVAVILGDVVDTARELALPGVIDLLWSRSYSSRRWKEKTYLGQGGWALSLEQWLEETPRNISLRAEDGRDVYFGRIAAGESSFHRRERLTLTTVAHGEFEVRSAKTRLTRVFARPKDGKSRLRAIRDDYGHRIELLYDADRLVTVRDTAGRELRIQHDDGDRIRRVEIWARAPPHPSAPIAAPPPLELQQGLDYEYDEWGHLVRATDALGHSDRYAYDGYNRIVAVSLKNGTTFRYRYDPEHGRCIKTWGDGGLHTVEFSYDFAKHTTHTSATPEPRQYTGTPDGYTLREETLDGSFARVYEYDKDNFVLSVTNAAGEATSVAYDERGNQTALTDAAGNVTRWEYADDRPTKRVSPDGLETRFAHDGRGALTEIVYPSTERFTLSYDGEGRLTAVHGAEGLFAGYVYDEHHNVIEELDARGARTLYRYDALGRPVARVDALGRATRVDYDRMGRPITFHRPDGTTTHAEYDALGNVSRFTDALGQTTSMEYGGTGVLTRFQEPSGQSWQLEYDRAEHLRVVKNPRAELYEFLYDRAGRVVEERPFDGRRLRYTYSKAERLTRLEHAGVEDAWRSFHYDPLGNVTEDLSPHGAIHFKRDPLGRLTKAVVDEVGGKTVTELDRDALGRVTAQSQNGKTLRYEYDTRGRRVSRTLPDGETTRYAYDPLGALVGVEHAGHRVLLQRDVLGREIRKHVYKGQIDIQSAYDAMDRLVDRRVAAPAPAGGAVQILSERRYAYDAAGRLRGTDDTRWGNTAYEYDAIGQLIEARRGAHREVFEYDVTGSLQNVLGDLSEVGRAAPWKVGQGNVLTERPGVRYENDEQRRRTKAIEQKPDGTEQITEYIWDCRDRLREIRKPSGDRVRYTYDAFARRVSKDVVPAERLDMPAMIRLAVERGKDALPKVRVTEYLWDGDALAAEVDSERGQRTFVDEPGTLVPLLQAEHGEVFTVVNDHLGMPKELVDQDGRVAWSAAHSAWGKVVETWRDPLSGRGRRERAVESPFRLLGQYEDGDAGLCYTRYRWFDAGTGRWCSPDPLGIAGGRNLLAFDGSPTGVVDPLGLCGEPPADGPKDFTPEQQALVDMAKADKRAGGITAGDMEAYNSLNAEAGSKGFTEPNAVRGPEVHPLRTPQSKPGPGQKPHGHVGPVGHIPVIAL